MVRADFSNPLHESGIYRISRITPLAIPVYKIVPLNFYIATKAELKEAGTVSTGEDAENSPSAKQVQAGLYLRASYLKYGGYVDMGQKEVASIKEALRHIEKLPTAELILPLVGYTMGDLEDKRMACICLLRRTWCGNACIDYLTATQDFLASDPNVSYKMIGLNTLMAALKVARLLKCSKLWLETASDSAGFYESVLDAQVSDLCEIAEIDEAIVLLEKKNKEVEVNLHGNR